MVTGLAIATFVFVAALASIEALGELSDVGRRAFGDTPPALAALAGSRSGFDVFTPLGLLAFAFNHPFFLALSLAVGVGIGSAAIAGDVESGRAQLWYAQPIPRQRILRGRLLFWLGAQTLVVAAGVAGGVLASASSDSLGADGVAVAARAGVQFFPLALAVGATAFAVSAFARTLRRRCLSARVRIRVNMRCTSESSGLRVLSTRTWTTSLGSVVRRPSITSPVKPSMEIQSPCLRVFPATRISCRS